MRTLRSGYETPPSQQFKTEKVPPSSFFSSPVIEINKHNIDKSAAAALEKDSSLQCEDSATQICKVVARQNKRTNLEVIEILSTSEEEETIAITSKAAKKRRLVTSTPTEKPTIVKDRKHRDDTTSTKQLTRKYYHARTNEPYASAVGPQDDSGCEDDSEWLHARSEYLMNEFDDVSEKEKKFMNLWNRFIKCHHVVADKHIPLNAENFVLRNRNELREHDLRMNLLLHLSNLWDFGLVSNHKLLSCMAIYDDVELCSTRH